MNERSVWRCTSVCLVSRWPACVVSTSGVSPACERIDETAELSVRSAQATALFSRSSLISESAPCTLSEEPEPPGKVNLLSVHGPFARHSVASADETMTDNSDSGA